MTEPAYYDDSGEILEIDLPDLHAGLFSWHEETMEDYDIHIAKTNLMKCLDDIINRCSGRKFSKIIFATLGDLLHVDNDNQTTARGTFQQIDGRIPKVFDMTLDALIDAVGLLGAYAPVEVVYVAGNHDKTLGYALMKALEKAYRNDCNILFDISPNPRKFRRFENVLIGWLHGDCAKNNISEWLQTEARKDFGKCLFAEVHAGHYHHQQTIEKSGMIVRFLPTICASSAWEHQRGYGKNVKTVVSFVWNRQKGLRETWFSNI
jgi:DNA repair exonuclease SbcCD nuclease subunit